MAAGSADIAALRAEYTACSDRYEAVAKWVSEDIARRLEESGFKVRHDWRVKTFDSLAKKMYRKTYASIADVTDIAGARIVVASRDQISNVCSIIEDGMVVIERQDKSLELGATRMGYRGVHLQVRVPSSQSEIEGLECEVQVRTRAEDLWSVYSHEIHYKSDTPLPDDQQRKINRLAALIEIFDEEVVRTMQYLDSLPKGAEYTWARLLESLFHDAGEADFDRELTMGSVRVLHGILAGVKPDLGDIQYPLLQHFFEDNRDKITNNFERVRQFSGNPLIRQPESILTWFLMDSHLLELTHGWRQEWDDALLEDLALAWGVRLPEIR